MAIQIRARLSTNITFLLSEGTETVDAVSSTDVAGILDDPTAQLLALGGVAQVVSIRSQWLVNLAAGRLVVQDQSGGIDPREQLADVALRLANLFVPAAPGRFRDYGYNFEVAFEVDGDAKVIEVLKEKLLRNDLLHDVPDASLTGASSVRLVFDWQGTSCLMTIEARLGKLDATEFFSGINFNHPVLAGGDIPSANDMARGLTSSWNGFKEILERVVT